jgi:hypothetical protein
MLYVARQHEIVMKICWKRLMASLAIYTYVNRKGWLKWLGLTTQIDVMLKSGAYIAR